jgi:lon-related putative ATP-dependent protease
VRRPTDSAQDPRFRRYLVNVMATNGESATAGAPLVEENNPTFGNVVGRIEHIAQMGTLVTDFLLIKPGALHKANGGYLLVDARRLLLSPFAWEALKRAIKSREIRIEQPTEVSGLISSQTLDPEPIPLDVKVVLFGDRELYYLLAAHDPDFPRLFKVQADFDDTIARSSENDNAYARLIASVVKEHGLKPLDATAVARVIDEGARLADDREKLSIELGRISDIVREADYWSSQARRQITTREDVARAIEEQIQRADRLRDRAQETIARGIVLVDTEGAEVGRINGLSVIQLGSFAFGRPSRITARVRVGSGRVTDIEREAKLGGPLHSKGVMILWGLLAGRYALDVPLALAATLVFEQSYGGVDGDSASSAELYALMSALSDVPIKQSLAVTGSVNQQGEVQAIGGVNEKIEGFYDICRARRLDGRQGVLIPKSNVQHLMLREDVVEAVKSGQFSIYPVSTIDEGIEILTGVKAGERGADGRFPAGTVNRLVEDKLKAFAERSRSKGSRESNNHNEGPAETA